MAAGACGHEAGSSAQGEPPAILSETGDAELFVGQSAFFQVRASGTALTYQWSRDGVAIPGANDSHYTTPPLALEDDGAAYQVEVTSGDTARSRGRVTRLAVRAPYDLRFQWVGAPVTLAYRRLADVLGWMTTVLPGVGAPLHVGDGNCAVAPPPQNCAWEGAGDPRVPGFWTHLHGGALADFGPAWIEALPAGSLVTSLDLQESAEAFGAAVLASTQRGTFTPFVGSVTLDALAATAAAEGSLGRILTAVSFRGGLVTYVSYAWSEAPPDRYEARVLAATVAGVGAAAAELAAEGYVITALGAGNRGGNGVVMVGTRREGDAAPREVRAVQVGFDLLTPPGFAAVGYLRDLTAHTTTMIYER